MASIQEALLERGIRLRGGYSPGSNTTIPCPRAGQCGARQPHDHCLSVKIDDDGEGATWQCHRASCGGWAEGIRTRAEPAGFVGRPRKRTYRRPAPPHEQPRTDSLYAFCEQRGIPREVVDAHGLYVTRHWFPQLDREERCIAFPYRVDGELVNVKYRTKGKHFVQEKDAEKVFYGVDDCIGHVECIIVEGEFDKLAMAVAGYPNTLSVPDGAPAQVRDVPVDPERDAKFEYVWNCIGLIERMQRIYLAVDMDGPGRALEEELARRIGRDRIYRVRWPLLANDVQVKDANEALLACGPEAIRACVEAAEPYPIANLYRVEDYTEKVMALYRGEIDRGLTTGYPELDLHFKLNGSGLLVILTGVPGHGKSEWVDQICYNYADLHGWVTGYCSFENPPERHIAKLAEKHTAKVFLETLGTIEPRMSEDDLVAAMDWLHRYMLFIRADDEAPTIDWILGKARVAVLRYGMKVLVIDPYNEIEHKRPPNQTETEYVSDMLAKLKRFGAAHGVDVLFVAHPRKLERTAEGGEPAPTLYDISGSANFFNKADFGITIWRDRGLPLSNTTAYIRKVKWKHLGREGEVEFGYNPDNGIYSEAV